MIDVKKASDSKMEGQGPLWWLWSMRGAWRVLFKCSNGHQGTLQHEIDAEGRVSPSCQCPEPGCSFHEHIRLLDWQDTQKGT